MSFSWILITCLRFGVTLQMPMNVYLHITHFQVRIEVYKHVGFHLSHPFQAKSHSFISTTALRLSRISLCNSPIMVCLHFTSLLPVALLCTNVLAVPTELEKRISATTCGKNAYSSAKISAALNAGCNYYSAGTHIVFPPSRSSRYPDR